MPAIHFSKLLFVCFLGTAAMSLPGCGPSTEPEGPQLGELQSYMSEHPELMDTADEEMDDIEGNEFAEEDE